MIDLPAANWYEHSGMPIGRAGTFGAILLAIGLEQKHLVMKRPRRAR